MPRVFSSDSVLLVNAMREHLNSWNEKPATFLIEDLGKEIPSIMIQQLSAAQKKKVYVNGSYIGVWKFAVYVRVSGRDTASRLDAIACLNDLTAWLTETDEEGKFVRLPYVDDVRMATYIEADTTPSIAARYDSGVEDYQAVYSLEYKVRRN